MVVTGETAEAEEPPKRAMEMAVRAGLGRGSSPKNLAVDGGGGDATEAGRGGRRRGKTLLIAVCVCV